MMVMVVVMWDMIVVWSVGCGCWWYVISGVVLRGRRNGYAAADGDFGGGWWEVGGGSW